ncbi:MAG: flagellar basal body L-ring protein FlgH [Planctomycetota bacterium]
MNDLGEPDPSLPLRGLSMLVLEPPPPQTFEPYDLVTIVVNESSQQTRGQVVNIQKRLQDERTLGAFPDPVALLNEQTLQDLRNDEDLDLFDYEQEQRKQAFGDYERTDRIINRITARVVDVKPNGTLVLEARTTIQTDEEVQEFVLTGICRTEDVTTQNTVQSSQMYGLNIASNNQGELPDAMKRGWLTRMLSVINPF